MSDDIIIDVRNVWKRYGLPPVLPWKKAELREEECALKDISFQVRRGGSLGILGRNGAGKSTLLKVLAGVTPPDRGSVNIRGRIFPMIELSAGISMDLTGRENIRLLATIMGFNDREIRRIEPEVVDFSELDHWIDRPVWQYSSGMLARLGFGIAVHMRADILLVDEVLSTGDLMFQKKCQKYVQKLLSGGTTLIFVTHSPYQMEKLCEQGILLDLGRCIFEGSASQTMREYLRRSISATSSGGKRPSVAPMDERPGTGDMRMLRCWLTDVSGQPTESITTGEAITVNIAYRAKEDISTVLYSLTLFDGVSNVPIAILAPTRQDGGFDTIKAGEGLLTCHIPSFPAFGNGMYFNVKFSTTYLLDVVEYAAVFDAVPTPEIAQATGSRGIIYCEHEWSLKPGFEAGAENS